jgi:hypothetical protein
MTTDMTAATISFVVDLEPAAAFERLVAELERRLASDDDPLRVQRGADGGIVQAGGERVADVRDWSADGLTLAWRPPAWTEGPSAELRLRCEPAGEATRIVVECSGWEAPLLSGGASEPLAWLVDCALGPLLLALTPQRLGIWLTDRRARRPTGPRAREVYRYPKEHQSGYDATLEALALRPDDVLLEVGCGGGAFMRQALERGCRATAVDHSDEMVDLTSEANAEAIAEGRLHVVRGDAAKLPFDAGAFTAAAMTHVFFFLPEPQAAIDECRRVLGDRGRLAIYTAAPELRGTPAAPEPIARQMRFYSDEELEGMAHAAGFGSASVTRGDGAQLLVAQV